MRGESQIPSLATLFSLSGPGIWDSKSLSVYDVSTGKLGSGEEVFSDTAKRMSSVQQMFDDSLSSSLGNKPSSTAVSFEWMNFHEFSAICKTSFILCLFYSTF